MSLKIVFPVLLLLMLGTLCNSIAQDVRIVSDFERATIGSLKQVAPNKFKGQTMHWIKSDHIGNQCYFFYFKVVNSKNKSLTFELDNLVGTYRGKPHHVYTNYTQPVVSYDNKNWTRIEGGYYNEENKSFTFEHFFKEDTAWIAYAHPYSYTQSMSFINDLVKLPDVEMIAEGCSPENRSIPIIEITNQKLSNDTKRRILIMSMQHPGEDAGAYVVEGMMKFLTSDHEIAQLLKDEFVFYFIPLMNPDGLFHGVSRYTPKMEDLNDVWLRNDPDNIMIPAEIQFVQNWVDELYHKKNQLDLFIDIHCHTQFNRNIAMLDRTEDGTLEGFVRQINSHWHTIYSQRNPFSNNSTNYYTMLYGIPSGTLELSQSDIKSNNGPYLSVEDYRNYGINMLEALVKFYNLN